MSGIAAGTVNAVVGSGTLITFPVLLAVGYPPVVANVSNAVGLVPGLLGGAYGYRGEIDEPPRRLVWFGAASLLGGTTGALLLLALPPSAFRAIVPAFIALAVVLILAQPLISGTAAHRLGSASRGTVVAVLTALFVCGVYGGYFGAAQGVLLLAILGFVFPNRLQTANGVKNVLNLITNVVAAGVFVLASHVDWGVVALIAAGSTIGGLLGARVGRRLTPAVLRSVVVAVGTIALVKLLAD